VPQNAFRREGSSLSSVLLRLGRGGGGALNLASTKPHAGQAAGRDWSAGRGAWPHLGQWG